MNAHKAIEKYAYALKFNRFLICLVFFLLFRTFSIIYYISNLAPNLLMSSADVFQVRSKIFRFSLNSELEHNITYFKHILCNGHRQDYI